MEIEEYTVVSKLLQYTKAVHLLLEWSKQCDFGFDNFRDDEVINWEEFEKETENMNYTESMIYYANKYLFISDDPTSTRIKDMNISEFIVQKPLGYNDNMIEEKISIEKMAEKHNLGEEVTDDLFFYWDVNSWNDVEHTLNEIAKNLSSEQYIHFLTDVLKYIHQTEFDLFEKGEMRYVPDKDTCNPKICMWCKYSNNGIRDPARSITLCDGCKYNEEFEHI